LVSNLAGCERKVQGEEHKSSGGEHAEEESMPESKFDILFILFFF